jgi:HAD superfamily hydrolase (TIGR01509 family)
MTLARPISNPMIEPIECILFDMDNVLCRYDRSTRAARLAEISGTSADDIYRAIWESGFEALGDCGALSTADYLKDFGSRIGYPLTLNQWLDARRTSMQPDHTMLELVGQLSNSVEIAVLTNNSELVADHIDVLCPQLRPLFGRRIYASAKFKAAKPDVACYERCLVDLQMRPRTVLFVDDLPENVVGARKAGLHAIHFTSVDGFRTSVRQYGF